MIGDHHRDSHSPARGITLLAVALEERLVARVPKGPLPAGRLVKDGSELELSCVDGAEARRAGGLPLLGGVHDPVHLVEALARPGDDVIPGALVVIETGDVGLVDVDLRSTAAHLLRHRPADAGAFFDPARRDRPEPLYLRCLPEHRKAVGCHRDEPVYGIADADFLVPEDLGHELEGILQLGVEVVLGERQLGRRQHRLLDGGDLVGLDDDRAVRI